MGQLMTTLWKNIQGRAEFLTRMTERKNCGDIEGEILTEAQRCAYALCEEIGRLREEVRKLKKQ